MRCKLVQEIDGLGLDDIFNLIVAAVPIRSAVLQFCHHHTVPSLQHARHVSVQRQYELYTPWASPVRFANTPLQQAFAVAHSMGSVMLLDCRKLIRRVASVRSTDIAMETQVPCVPTAGSDCNVFAFFCPEAPVLAANTFSRVYRMQHIMIYSQSTQSLSCDDCSM